MAHGARWVTLALHVGLRRARGGHWLPPPPDQGLALLLPRRGAALSPCDRSNSFPLSDVCLLQEDFADPRVGPGDPSAYQCPLGVPLLGLDLPGPGVDAQQMLVKQSPGVLSLQPREEVPCTGTKVGSLQGGKESSGLGMGVGRSRAPALLQERPAGRERGAPAWARPCLSVALTSQGLGLHSLCGVA